jgi:hypothetical protein
MLEEYADVLGDHPEFVAEIVESFPVCYPLTELGVIRDEPDNRFRLRRGDSERDVSRLARSVRGTSMGSKNGGR